jgi:mono/diheme cytochrome c family protein
MRLVSAALAVALVVVPAAQAPSQENAGGDVARGRYLAEQVAMCVECHTPRDLNGELLRSQLFLGASVPVQTPGWVKEWAIKAPRIAGMAQYDEAAAVRLLTTGVSRNGRHLLPPMPQFRMSAQDARDIYAYLKSLR